MIKKVLLFSVLGVLLVGCGGPHKRYWKKQGVSPREARQTLAECRYRVGMKKFNNRHEKKQLIIDCMLMQGYRFR